MRRPEVELVQRAGDLLEWKGSTQLGTGVAVGTAVIGGRTYNATYVVCQYSPAGNMSDSYAANVLEP